MGVRSKGVWYKNNCISHYVFDNFGIFATVDIFTAFVSLRIAKIKTKRKKRAFLYTDALFLNYFNKFVPSAGEDQRRL